MSSLGRAALRLTCLTAVALIVLSAATSASAAGTLVVEPSEATFVLPPGKADSRTVTVRNTGPDAVQISDIYFFGDVDPFDFLDGSCDLGLTLPTAGECSLELEFAPTDVGDSEVTLVVEGAPGDEPGTATFVGRSRPPGKIVVTPSSIDFGGVRMNSVSAPQAVRLHNDGGTPIEIGWIGATGDIGGGTNIVSNGCRGELAPLATCEVSMVLQAFSSLVMTSERAVQSMELWISAYAWDGFPARTLLVKVPMRGTILKPSGEPYPSKDALTNSLKARLSRMATAAIRLARGGPARRLWLRFQSDGVDGKLGLTLRARVGKRWVAIGEGDTAVARHAGARFSLLLSARGTRLLRTGKPVRVRAETRFAATDRFVLGGPIKVTEREQVKPVKPKKKRKRR